MDNFIAVDIRGYIYFVKFEMDNHGRQICWFEGLSDNATKFNSHAEAVTAMKTIQTEFPMAVSRGESYKAIFKHAVAG
jgi:hypothetical protein